MRRIHYIELDYGMGDNIICASIINKLSEDYDIVIKIPRGQEKNRLSYETFFDGIPGLRILDRDGTNIKYHLPPLYSNGKEVIASKEIDIPGKLWGRLGTHPITNKLPYPMHFFAQFNMDPQIRFTHCPLRMQSFKVKQLPAPKLTYTFLHEDPERNLFIQNPRSDHELTIKAEPLKDTSILAYREMIENAGEIHCMDSSFLHLVTSFKPKGKLFYHTYVKPNSPEFKMYTQWKRVN